MTFEPLQWLLAALGAFMVGVSKSGITGLSILSVALFTHIFPSSKQASGIVLPLLIFGDFVAVFSYRRHTQWRYIWRLFPFTAAGVVIGYFTLGSVSDRHARVMIGAIIVSLAALSYWRRYGSAQSDVAASHRSWVFAASVGVVAGFITLVANAAGPLMAIYFVSMRLPKLEYVGTAAVFFLCLNLFKVPFMVGLGLITVHSFGFNMLLAPAVVLGAFVGRWLVTHINQALFEQLVLALSAIGGFLLLL
jgi:uncharacterized membrane protein YfcA